MHHLNISYGKELVDFVCLGLGGVNLFEIDNLSWEEEALGNRGLRIGAFMI